MDFDKYIGRERPLLARLDRDRAALNALERRGNAGTLDLAEDELKLLDVLRDIEGQVAAARAAVRAMDERAEQLAELEDALGKKGAQTQKRIEEWESSFGLRYNELLARVEGQVAALEQRNRDLLALAGAQESAFNARNAEVANKVLEAEDRIRQAGDAARGDVEGVLASVKKTQKEFEASVTGKLEEDRQTIERIKYMLSSMSDIIKS